MSSDTEFTCFFGGTWFSIDGHVGYDGGECVTLNGPSVDLFKLLEVEPRINFHGQKTWYKLPFEELDERKQLRKGENSFLKMCDAALYTNQVDIFVDIAPGDNETNEEGYDAGTEHVNGDEETAQNHQFPEEARVEVSVADFVDEEPSGEETPVCSDDEGVQYVKCKKGELKLMAVYDNLEDFKEAVVDYVLKEGWNVKFSRWGKDQSEATCAIKEGNCPWKVYCSYEKPAGKWMIKTFIGTHTCIKDGYSKVLKQEVIAKLFIDEIRNDPELKPRIIQEQIEQRWNLIATIDKCKKGKNRALEIIQKEHDEQFSRMKDYEAEILASNPGTLVCLETIPGEGDKDKFYRFYVCFDVLRKAWIDHCRPVIGVDGCFLKCTTKGQLLAAVGRDANNQMFPIAWAVVDIENTDNWVWFIEKLKVDLRLGDGDGVALISDRQKGLIIAVETLLPKVEHRMCARHIYGNLKKLHPKKANMKGLFWKVAKSYNMARYEKKLEEVRQYDIRVYEDMMEKNPRNCSNAFFKAEFCCEDVHNNISESFNNAIDQARAMPLVEMLETIRRRTMVRMDIRRKISGDHTGKFSLKVAEAIAEEQRKVTNCRVFPGANGWYEVVEKGSGFKVNMRRFTCSCRRWDMTGIPCRHALKVISVKKWTQEDYISAWFLTERWRKQYENSITPMEGIKFWRKSDATTLVPPERE